jgi:hypothetical protein
MYQANSKNELLCSYLQERNYLGYSYTTSLFGVFSKKITGLVPISGLTPPAPRQQGDSWPPPVKFVAFVDEAKSHVSAKSGKPYYKMTLSDDSGSVRCMVFGQEKLDACRSFNGCLPQNGDIVIASGNLTGDGGVFFADSVLIQPPLVQIKKKS